MTTHLDTGVQGAKRQSWRHGPRELLIAIIDELGTTDHATLLEEFTERALEPRNRSVQAAIVEYWFTNHLRSLLADQRAPYKQGARAQRLARTETLRKEIVHRVKLAANQVLLDLMLPHGKKLSDSTGAECSEIGGWLSAVGDGMKPDQLVGAVFTEKQMRKIFAESGMPASAASHSIREHQSR